MHTNQFYTYHTNILLWFSHCFSPYSKSFPPAAPSWAADVDEAQEPANSHEDHGSMGISGS